MPHRRTAVANARWETLRDESGLRFVLHVMNSKGKHDGKNDHGRHLAIDHEIIRKCKKEHSGRTDKIHPFSSDTIGQIAKQRSCYQRKRRAGENSVEQERAIKLERARTIRQQIGGEDDEWSLLPCPDETGKQNLAPIIPKGHQYRRLNDLFLLTHLLEDGRLQHTKANV